MGSLPVRWVREWQAPDGASFRVGREGERLVADWGRLGTLRASASGGDVEVIPFAGLDPTLARKWSRGPVRALLRHLVGRPTLHASAVALAERAFVFVGDSGAGKSTCAATLCARASAELLADDLAQVDFLDGLPTVCPSDADHWLASDSANALGHPAPERRKDPVPAVRVSSTACALAAVIDLTFSDIGAPLVTPIRGEEAFATLNAAYVRFIVDDAVVHLRDLEIMSSIVAAVPILRLERPRSLAALDQTVRILVELAADLDRERLLTGSRPRSA